MIHLRLLFILFACLIPAGCGDSSHPSDDALLHNFHRHEAEFEQLLVMLRTDNKLERVDNTWTRPEDPATIGVTAARVDTYRDLFLKLAIPRGCTAYHAPERFMFTASTFGLSVSGSAKGYAYMTETPEVVVPNLDTHRSADGRSFTAYRHIKGNWYLYFEYED